MQFLVELSCTHINCRSILNDLTPYIKCSHLKLMKKDDCHLDEEVKKMTNEKRKNNSEKDDEKMPKKSKSKPKTSANWIIFFSKNSQIKTTRFLTKNLWEIMIFLLNFKKDVKEIGVLTKYLQQIKIFLLDVKKWSRKSNLWPKNPSISRYIFRYVRRLPLRNFSWVFNGQNN